MNRMAGVLMIASACCGGADAALLAHYTFDNPSDLGADSQGFANGSLSGDTPVSPFNDPERGAVLQLSGGNTGYIHSSIGTLPGSGFTITTWVKSESWSNNRGVVQVQADPGTSVSTTTKVIGGWVSNSGVAWGRVIDSSGTQTLPQIGPSLTAGASADWHHLAYRGNGSIYEVFVDGSNVGTASIGYNGTLAPHSTLIIGRQGSETWSGLMDDFRVYDNALSNAEIFALATVPEPSSAWLLSGALLAATKRRRR